MGNEVVVSARVDLDEITKQLQALQNASKKTQNELSSAGKEAHDKVSRAAKNSSTSLEALRLHSRRIADEIKGAFESLLKVKAMDLNDAMVRGIKNTVTQSVALNDTLRKFSLQLGLSGDAFAAFQAKLHKGFTAIGMDADSAGRAIGGVAETQMTNQDSMVHLATTSAQLSQAGNSRGQEGSIAKDIGRVIRARGGDPNDVRAIDEITKALQKMIVSTKKSASDLAAEMAADYESYSTENRNFKPQAYGEKQAIGAAFGPQANKLVDEILQKNNLENMPALAQGLGKFKRKDGSWDMRGMANWLRDNMGRIGISPEASTSTLGFQNAQGGVLMGQNANRMNDVLAKHNGMNMSLSDQQRKSWSLGESAAANVNNVKGVFQPAVGKMTDFANETLKELSKNPKGSAIALTALGGLGLAGAGTILGKFGPKGLKSGSDFAQTAAKSSMAETLTGQKTIPVYVVNLHELGNGTAADKLAAGSSTIGGVSKGTSFFQKLFGAAAAAEIGYAIGAALEPAVTKGLDEAFTSTWKTSKGAEMTGNPIEHGFSLIADALESMSGGAKNGFEQFITMFRELGAETKSISSNTKKTKAIPGRGAEQ